MKVGISKVRFGREGNWDRIEYKARILSEEHKDLDLRMQWRLDSNKTLDELSLKLSLILNAFESLELVPYEKRYVSLAKSGEAYLLTQDMQVSDEELGDLGAQVQKYILMALKNRS